MLPCIAAVAIATFVGKQTFESNGYDDYVLMMENVEALSQDEGIRVASCYTEEGNEGEFKSVRRCASGTNSGRIFKCGSEEYFTPGMSGTCYQ